MKKITLAGCVVIKENSILLLHRIKTDWFELPGGKIEDGERAEQTACREFKEELLCDVHIIKKLGRADFEENGYVMGYIWYLAKITNNQMPEIGEKAIFDHFDYIPINKLKNQKLSKNMKNVARLLLSRL